MIKVFLGGSRRISKLNRVVAERINSIISKGYLILIGDANGADKAIQQYLFDKKYQNVMIFCTGDICRNNIGAWKIKNIYTDRNKKDFNYYTVKDLMMSEEADFGFMLWDGKSKGSLNNIFNLVERNKKVLVYFSPTKNLYTLNNLKDISNFLKLCDLDSLKKFDKTIEIHTRLNVQQELFSHS